MNWAAAAGPFRWRTGFASVPNGRETNRPLAGRFVEFAIYENLLYGRIASIDFMPQHGETAAERDAGSSRRSHCEELDDFSTPVDRGSLRLE